MMGVQQYMIRRNKIKKIAKQDKMYVLVKTTAVRRACSRLYDV